ncbi:Os03g0649100 [Oryza sativa Japonica Group]|uniref:Os03g0649100 protein n=2 Tax=Oryza sativa subsp. japonica TaxID=39947 RepID=Q60DI4_ORYSJ|nr:hypothetical protein LOC_Os03g44680 [Oryza sativa Japonica Group]ABF97908.1 hypothetical protein LOC_Os03g44680 [Oryza sativa Japonica Group]BAS85502.1 Os03g0649100 [Oryza sativa Japonica Group]
MQQQCRAVGQPEQQRCQLRINVGLDLMLELLCLSVASLSPSDFLRRASLLLVRPPRLSSSSRRGAEWGGQGKVALEVAQRRIDDGSVLVFVASPPPCPLCDEVGATQSGVERSRGSPAAAWSSELLRLHCLPYQAGEPPAALLP